MEPQEEVFSPNNFNIVVTALVYPPGIVFHGCGFVEVVAVVKRNFSILRPMDDEDRTLHLLDLHDVLEHVKPMGGFANVVQCGEARCHGGMQDDAPDRFPHREIDGRRGAHRLSVEDNVRRMHAGLFDEVVVRSVDIRVELVLGGRTRTLAVSRVIVRENVDVQSHRELGHVEERNADIGGIAVREKERSSRWRRRGLGAAADVLLHGVLEMEGTRYCVP